MELATFWFLAQCLNQLRHCVQWIDKRNITVKNRGNKQRKDKLRNGGKRMEITEQEVQ
jgi:hypothetical protein